MLGYYSNSNVKLRGGNLKEKVQTLVSWNFHKHLCGLTYIDITIHTNRHCHTQSYNKHTHIHILSHVCTSITNIEAILSWTYTQI